MRNLPVILIAFFSLLLLSCSSEENDKQIRAIKTLQVEHTQGGMNRRISGIVESAQRADLSFEVSGKVASVAVKLGSRVKAGDELARLDSNAYQLTVNAAQAELTKAQAILADRKSDYQAKAKLLEDRYVAKAMVDAAYADFQAAEQNAVSAKAKLDLAQRDLNNTILKAPFAGEVASLSLDPAVNVPAGQPVMQLLGDGGLEVAVLVPESLRSLLQVGMAVTVTFPSAPALKTTGQLSEIASRATETNAFPAKIKLEATQGIYPGLSAEVLFSFGGEGKPLVFLIPAVAIAPPESKAEEGFVFVYEPTTSTVVKKPIKIGGLQGTQVEILDGLHSGDIIAIAGVHFLYDGQKVKLMEGN